MRMPSESERFVEELDRAVGRCLNCVDSARLPFSINVNLGRKPLVSRHLARPKVVERKHCAQCQVLREPVASHIKHRLRLRHPCNLRIDALLTVKGRVKSLTKSQ